MRILVVGGTGHIGSYLVPRLVQQGHAVTVAARRAKPQYGDSCLGWKSVGWLLVDRENEEKSDAWFQRMAAIETDVVMDLICYTPRQMEIMYRAFHGRIEQFLHCGTIWAYGPPERAPYEESFPRKPITEYGRLKARIETFLLEKQRREGFPATIIHPGHICGRRWLPIDPQGSRDGARVYEQLWRGAPVYLPERGQATLHHVHADDVAQMFELAMLHRNVAVGESFSAVAPYALSLIGCCHAVCALFGTTPNLLFVPMDQMARHVGESSAGIIAEHILHSPCASIAKSQTRLGYRPRHTTEQIYAECLEYLLESGQLVLDGG